MLNDVAQLQYTGWEAGVNGVEGDNSPGGWDGAPLGSGLAASSYGDVDLSRPLAFRTLESMATPCSVKAQRRLRRPPRGFALAICKNASVSCVVSWNLKSPGNRRAFRRTPRLTARRPRLGRRLPRPTIAIKNVAFGQLAICFGVPVARLESSTPLQVLSHRLLEPRHGRESLEANISVKLTQLGLDLSESACRDHLEALTRRAAELGGFLRVDMESSAYTERTLSLVAGLHARYPAIGAVIQSSLYRSEQDLESLIGRRIRVRLLRRPEKVRND